MTGKGKYTGTRTKTFKLFRTYMQWDERWKYIPYGWNDIEHTDPAYAGQSGARGNGAGCALVSMANCLMYMKGTDGDPTAFFKDLVDYSLANGWKADADGTQEGFVKAFCKDNGKKWGIRFIKNCKTIAEMRSEILAGHAAVVHVPGYFVAVTYYNPKTDKYLVIDCAMSDARGTAPRGYRWMTPAKFTGDMALRVTFDGVNYPKRIQIFALRN